jgi:hypothetical protein
MLSNDDLKKDSIYYSKHKGLFVDIESILNESQNLEGKTKEDKASLNIEEAAIWAILTRCQKLSKSILILASLGHGEDAGVLVRTMFESYFNMKYIIKHRCAERFLKYSYICRKIFWDILEKYGTGSVEIRNEEFASIKEQIDTDYEKVVEEYRSKKNRLYDNWSGIDLRMMCRDLDDEEIEKLIKDNEISGIEINKDDIKGENEKAYIYIQKHHSIFVHCNPYGLEGFIRKREEAIDFENSPSETGIEIGLVSSRLIFGRICKLWANCLGIGTSAELTKVSETKMA